MPENLRTGVTIDLDMPKDYGQMNLSP